jgi:putative transposase
LVVGDVRGIEQNTRKKQRARKSQRQQLSQWSRGTQETYLAYKTGLILEHVPEYYTSQTCPKCGTRRKVSGRIYKCKNPECGLVIHRDVVGGVNIRSRSVNGGENKSKTTQILPSIDENTIVSVTYQRTQHFWTKPQSVLHSYHQDALGRSGVSSKSVGKSAVEAPNRAATSSNISIKTSSVAGKFQKVQPATIRKSRGVENTIFDKVTLSGLPQKF